MSIGIASRRRTLKRPRAAAHLTDPDPITTATRLRPTVPTPAAPMLARSLAEAGDGFVHRAEELQDAREAGQFENAPHVRLDRGQAQVAAPLAGLLDRFEQGAQAGARRVVHAGEVAD